MVAWLGLGVRHHSPLFAAVRHPVLLRKLFPFPLPPAVPFHVFSWGFMVLASQPANRHGLPDMAFQNGLQAGTWTFQKHGFVTDSDPHGSKSGSEGIPWQLFSSRISWEEPNPAIMSKMARNI